MKGHRRFKPSTLFQKTWSVPQYEDIQILVETLCIDTGRLFLFIYSLDHSQSVVSQNANLITTGDWLEQKLPKFENVPEYYMTNGCRLFCPNFAS